MLQINIDRYHKATGVDYFTDEENKSLLQRMRKKSWLWFYNKYESDYKYMYDLQENYIKHKTSLGRSVDSIVQDNQYKFYKYEHDPYYTHRLNYFISSIPDRVLTWLCCGLKTHLYYDTHNKRWYLEYNEKYNMYCKLIRCGDKRWPDYKFTTWDKIRFKIITGYKFEE